jgi:alpha-L-rhamnosidase
MAGPIFGASGKINLAFYDALRSMSLICSFIDTEDIYAGRADCLKHNIAEYLWDKKAGILCMSDLVLAPGICQDIHAYGITIGVTQPLLTSLRALTAPKTGELPLAFRNIDKWDRIKVVSPYASGFAAEALFTRGEGVAAVELIERVWGVMVDTSNPNYSGGHWEAMTQDGMPITTDCSLVHGWSTWPVFLLPQYLAGLKPLEPGWRRFKVRPVLANLTTVDVKLSTPAGEVEVSLLVDEAKGAGAITITAPLGSVAEIYAPEDWALANSKSRHEAEYLEKLVLKGQGEQVKLGMCKTAQLNHKDDESSVKSPSKVAEAIETLLLKSDSGAAQCQRENESTLTQFWRRTLKLFCK